MKLLRRNNFICPFFCDLILSQCLYHLLHKVSFMILPSSSSVELEIHKLPLKFLGLLEVYITSLWEYFIVLNPVPNWGIETSLGALIQYIGTRFFIWLMLWLHWRINYGFRLLLFTNWSLLIFENNFSLVGPRCIGSCDNLGESWYFMRSMTNSWFFSTRLIVVSLRFFTVQCCFSLLVETSNSKTFWNFPHLKSAYLVGL